MSGPGHGWSQYWHQWVGARLIPSASKKARQFLNQVWAQNVNQVSVQNVIQLLVESTTPKKVGV